MKNLITKVAQAIVNMTNDISIIQIGLPRAVRQTTINIRNDGKFYLSTLTYNGLTDIPISLDALVQQKGIPLYVGRGQVASVVWARTIHGNLTIIGVVETIAQEEDCPAGYGVYTLDKERQRFKWSSALDMYTLVFTH